MYMFARVGQLLTSSILVSDKPQHKLGQTAILKANPLQLPRRRSDQQWHSKEGAGGAVAPGTKFEGAPNLIASP